MNRSFRITLLAMGFVSVHALHSADYPNEQGGKRDRAKLPNMQTTLVMACGAMSILYQLEIQHELAQPQQLLREDVERQVVALRLLEQNVELLKKLNAQQVIPQ